MTLVEDQPNDRDALIEIAGAHFDECGMTGSEYRPGLHHLARAHSRRLLGSAAHRGDIARWELAAPGPNFARRAYYSNLHDDLVGLEFVPTDNLGVELPFDTDEDETFGQAGAPDA